MDRKGSLLIQIKFDHGSGKRRLVLPRLAIVYSGPMDLLSLRRTIKG